jgi:hypothetical protein
LPSLESHTAEILDTLQAYEHIARKNENLC